MNNNFRTPPKGNAPLASVPPSAKIIPNGILIPRTWNRGKKSYSISVASKARVIFSGGTKIGSFKNS
jgi:hypothetical protein